MISNKQLTAALLAVLTAVTIYTATVYPQIKTIICIPQIEYQQEQPKNHDYG